MKEFVIKENNVPGETGQVDASDYNSAFQELDNVVKPFLSFKGEVENQLIKSIDMMDKHPSYINTSGQGNALTLVRAGIPALTDIEIMRDGMQFTFQCKELNTGPVTATILTGNPEKPNLLVLPVKTRSPGGTYTDLVSNWLIPGAYYTLTYIQSAGLFAVDSASGDSLYHRKSYIDGTFYNRTQIDSRLSNVVREEAFVKGERGYIRYSNGLIMQWDTQRNLPYDGLSELITYPISFPTASVCTQLTYTKTSADTPRDSTDALLVLYNPTKSNYRIWNGVGNSGKINIVKVLAIGY